MVAPIIEDSTTMHKDDEYDDGDDAELAVPDPVPASRQSRQSKLAAGLLFMSSGTVRKESPIAGGLLARGITAEIESAASERLQTVGEIHRLSPRTSA